ncbi:DUF1249 family protein [Photobacterium aphoticum]|uniref:Dehydrogenase n=2 Tax=Photobacterium aphoticum TaxID=754436 RepID=A0A090QYX7_9GAMM|nr:DUF1249 family protein [Photobacterium aphoticum]PSU55011.1 DUF1249 domain-containing protein [Photobacterium aphoticum]GAL07054.1 hypothetical protein JCM19237_3059 [Photobacterium aphoticum]GHA66155.1 hypothetical protein GCM10007086_44640 [Photobacterium aphoticum]
MNKRYSVDFAGIMRLYETNYAKLLPLLPKSDEVGDRCVYSVSDQEYHLTVTESTRYTTLITLDLVTDDSVPDYLIPKMTIRLYHDARVAEVCSAQQTSRLKPRYDYPNLRMHQKDEKHQVNRFLGDWLAYCLKNGISRQSVC